MTEFLQNNTGLLMIILIVIASAVGLIGLIFSIVGIFKWKKDEKKQGRFTASAGIFFGSIICEVYCLEILSAKNWVIFGQVYGLCLIVLAGGFFCFIKAKRLSREK